MWKLFNYRKIGIEIIYQYIIFKILFLKVLYFYKKKKIYRF